jgi:hypothetical protein
VANPSAGGGVDEATVVRAVERAAHRIVAVTSAEPGWEGSSRATSTSSPSPGATAR